MVDVGRGERGAPFAPISNVRHSRCNYVASVTGVGNKKKPSIVDYTVLYIGPRVKILLEMAHDSVM